MVVARFGHVDMLAVSRMIGTKLVESKGVSVLQVASCLAQE